jgi:hypothetical protein
LADVSARATREDLDDDHAAAAARAGAGQDARLVRRSGLLLLGLSDARRSTEQLVSMGAELSANVGFQFSLVGRHK